MTGPGESVEARATELVRKLSQRDLRSPVGFKHAAEAITALVADAVREENEACEKLHVEVDMTDGRDAWGAVVDYRELIRARRSEAT